jgi:hypothetical protein
MDIKEVRVERRKLESEIHQAISNLVDRFIAKTDMGVEIISVRMIDVTQLGDDKRKYTMGQVEVELERI